MAFIVPQNEILIQWIKKLDNTRLPVYKAHRELALQALKNPSNSLREIAKIISRAPTIAFILMREANRNHSSLAEPVQTLENALSRLGLQRCSTLLNSLQDSDISEIPQALRQVWLIGQHLNIQAVGLFSTRMARLWQEIHWGSLLFLSPAWPLLTRHPEFFAQWEQRVLGNNEPAEQVERELLGMPLTALCLGLAEHWQLPLWVIEAIAYSAKIRSNWSVPYTSPDKQSNLYCSSKSLTSNRCSITGSIVRPTLWSSPVVWLLPHITVGAMSNACAGNA